jgi:hypothetical protein
LHIDIFVIISEPGGLNTLKYEMLKFILMKYVEILLKYMLK